MKKKPAGHGASPLPSAILLYGIEKDSALEQTLVTLADALGLKIIRASAADLSRPVSELIGLGTVSVCTKPYSGAVLNSPFLLLAGLNDLQQSRMLNGLRSSGTSIDLKAVLTDTNRKWSLGALIREVAQEHLALHKRS